MRTLQPIAQELAILEWPPHPHPRLLVNLGKVTKRQMDLWPPLQRLQETLEQDRCGGVVTGRNVNVITRRPAKAFVPARVNSRLRDLMQLNAPVSFELL